MLTRIIIVVLVLISGQALALDSRNVQHFFEEHAVAKQGLIEAWADRLPPDQMSRYVYSIAKYETYLVAAGAVSANDQRLVGHLAENIKLRSKFDYDAFAYQVFKHEMHRMTGFQPRVENLFRNRSFEVMER